MNYALAAGTLCWRELLRFLRQRHRIVGALGTPIVFWIIIGSGLGTSFRTAGPGGSHYLEYSYPGMLALILLFSAIFSTISIIEDRQTGFLQGVLIAPVPRSAISLGKVTGGTLLAYLQSMVFVALAPTVGISLGPVTLAELSGVLLLVGFALTSLGTVIAWKLDSTQGFHAIMNLILMPMWLLSGAFFPPSGAPGWIRAVILANPLTYGVGAIRHLLYPGGAPGSAPPLELCLAISACFAAIAFGVATKVAGRAAPE